MCAEDSNEMLNLKLLENPFGFSQVVARGNTKRMLMNMFCNSLLQKGPKIFVSFMLRRVKYSTFLFVKSVYLIK